MKARSLTAARVASALRREWQEVLSSINLATDPSGLDDIPLQWRWLLAFASARRTTLPAQAASADATTGRLPRFSGFFSCMFERLGVRNICTCASLLNIFLVFGSDSDNLALQKGAAGNGGRIVGAFAQSKRGVTGFLAGGFD
jgi:hypothetical protein